MLWRATMPTPRPSIDANETNRTAHRLVSTMVEVSPVSMPALDAPANLAIRPAAPSTAPPMDDEFFLVQNEWYLGEQGEASSLAKANTGAPAPT